DVGVRIVPNRQAIRGDVSQVDVSYLDASGHEIWDDYPDLDGSAQTGYFKPLPAARTHQVITFRCFPPLHAASLRIRLQPSRSGRAATIANSVLVAAQKRGLSVVVPVYRAEAFIGRLLRSLAEQTLGRAHFEAIFVINGPPDGSGAIIDAWAH